MKEAHAALGKRLVAHLFLDIRPLVVLYYVAVRREESAFILFLRELMRRRKRLPSQLAADIGVSHATVSRWVHGIDIPSPTSCRRLAEYAGVRAEKILAIAGHLPIVAEMKSTDWPEFREYARQKYSSELDEDLITMIEDLIERRRQRRYGGKDAGSGK